MTNSLELTGIHVWRNTVRLGYPVLESFLSTIDMVDEVVLCVDPTSDGETIRLARAIQDKFDKVNLVWFEWPIGTSGDGRVIGVASSFALQQARTSHVINIQGDEIYGSELSSHIKENWRGWARDGIECIRFKVLNLESNMQEYQGGGNWDWQTGSGYNHSYKLCKKCLNTRYIHDAWSFDWNGFVHADAIFSEKFPIVHAHNNFRDSLIDLRQAAANEIWTDDKYGPMYKKFADDLEESQKQWYDDPKWTRTDSPFGYLIPDFAKGILGQTRYAPNYDLLERWPL